MRIYTATDTKTDEKITVRGETIEDAAEHAVHRLVGRSATAYRCTGDRGNSGIFQGYVSCPSGGIGGLTKRGNNIHVM